VTRLGGRTEEEAVIRWQCGLSLNDFWCAQGDAERSVTPVITPGDDSGKARTSATSGNRTSSLSRGGHSGPKPGMMQAGIRNLPGAVIIGGGI